jgi:hypothetical protein
MKMKTTSLITIIVLLMVITMSCSRSVTPYQAAMGMHGKKCLRVK